MAKIYAELILKGFKKLDDVPERLKEQVKALLNIAEGEGINV